MCGQSMDNIPCGQSTQSCFKCMQRSMHAVVRRGVPLGARKVLWATRGQPQCAVGQRAVNDGRPLADGLWATRGGPREAGL